MEVPREDTDLLSQKAPSAIRCIKTLEAAEVPEKALRVRKHRAP